MTVALTVAAYHAATMSSTASPSRLHLAFQGLRLRLRGSDLWFIALALVVGLIAGGLTLGGKLLDVRNNWRGFKSLFGRQGRMTRLAPKFLDFFRPGFHPDDHDTKALVAEWRERLFGVNGEVNHLLKGRVVH